MILAARALPTPGRDSRTAETRILPMTSSVSPCLRTSPTVVPLLFSRSRSSARALRAAAAFSRAAARCSGDNSGRGTEQPNRVHDGCQPGGCSSGAVHLLTTLGEGLAVNLVTANRLVTRGPVSLLAYP